LGFGLASATAFPAAAQSVTYVSQPAGLVRLTVAPGQTLISLPLKPINASIGALFPDQLTGGSGETSGDGILAWDAVNQVYVKAFKAAGTGDPARDGKWFTDSVTWTPSPLTLNPGEGFWIANRQAVSQTVYLGGNIVADSSRSSTLRPGLNLIGYPFSGRIALNSTQLARNGANGDRSPSTSDSLTDPATGATQWLLKKGKSKNLAWYNADGSTATQILGPAAGYWFEHKTSTTFTWTEPRPYAYPFISSPSAPRISGIQAAHGVATLTLDTSACPTGTVEIYFKDFAATDPFSGTNGWLLAAQGLSPQGRTSLTWTDGGATNRAPIAAIFTRVYLAARGDVDGDADGLPDARETFVLGTDPAIPNGGTPPPPATTGKLKGLRVGLGDYYGGPYTGLGTDAVVDLICRTAASWGCNTLYAHAFTSSYGTYWANPRTAYLAAEGGHGKNDILRKLIAQAHTHGLKVIAYVELNRMKTAWDANPSWRLKAADGADFKATQYPLSVYNTHVVAWTREVVTELLDLGVDGVDMAESDLLAWATEATYDTAANARYFSAYPAGTLGDANWVALRRQVLTDWHADIGRLIHSRGKTFHVTYMWNAYSDGRLWDEAYLADRTGFSFNQLLNLPPDARPDWIVAELIWQSQAARYGSAFTASWTASAATQFMTFVAGRAKACAHAEAGTFTGTYTATPGPSDIQTSLELGLANSDGADLYDHDLVYRTPYTVNGTTSNWGAVAVSNAYSAATSP
jgi:hypothetical protein